VTLLDKLKRLFHDGFRFGIIGLVGFVIDTFIFNALSLGAIGSGHFFQGPLGAKIVAVAVATIFTWFGNRYWTFRDRRRHNFWLELLEFGGIGAVGIGISDLCLFISHYLLGFTSLLADNISGNGIGLIIATTFRFLMYRYWVYGMNRTGQVRRGPKIVSRADDEVKANASTEPDQSETATPISAG
jgi:putative flippase GtrA